jgi:lipoprotein-releasing system permease protein
MMAGPSFPLQVAVRFLKEGRTQSALILIGAGVGVAVLVFLSCLITSLQNSLITQTLGSQAHIVVRPPDEVVSPVRTEQALRSVEKAAQRLTPIEQWPRVLDAVKTTPGIVATSPVVSGSGQALRGLAKRAVTVRGIVPESFDGIIDLQGRMKQGTWQVSGDGCLVGTELARELGLAVGDRTRILVDDEHSTTCRVQGIFDLGAKDVNLRWVLVPLRQAQTLFALDGGISLIEARVDDIFAATAVAGTIAARTGLVADSWMTLNAQLMTALQSQGSSSDMIQFFVIVAVALGISSVLVVSVVQKGKEVGILRAMGASSSQIQRVFLWQGAIVGVSGSVLGTTMGLGLLGLFKMAPLTFTIETPPALIIRACVIALVTGLVAAVVPARRAAKLDPAVAIRS